MQLPSRPEGFSTPADCAACRMAIRQGSHSFYLASLFLPVAIREPAYGIYAFCRMADDLIDRDGGGTAGVRTLRRMLDRVYAGRPGADFVERAFADVVARFHIPRAVPDALVEGLSWDAAGRRYADLDALEAYAVRVAGTVGIMMTLVMGGRDPRVLARACDLGVAMQLTNIARDIGEDAAAGRLYMPLGWLADAGVDAEAWLARPAYSAPVRGVVARLLGEAERLYERSLSGIDALPGACRLGIAAARLLYREIGREIGRGADPVAARTVTSRRRKLRLLSAGLSSGGRDRRTLDAPPVAAAAVLIERVTAAPRPRREPSLPPWWDVNARSVRMVELLARFGARETGSRLGANGSDRQAGA